MGLISLPQPGADRQANGCFSALKVCIGFRRVEWLPSPKFHSYQRGWLEVSVQRTISGCGRLGDERYDWAHETTVFEDVRVKSSCVAVTRGSLSTYWIRPVQYEPSRDAGEPLQGDRDQGVMVP